MTRILKIIILIIVCFSFIGCVIDTDGLMTGDDLAKASLKDGVYKGEYIKKPLKLPFIETRSIVTIKDGKLSDIELPSYALGKYKFKYRYQLKKIPKDMVKQQSVVVDAVSGATYSSFAIMQAVQDAINKAIITNKTETPKGGQENHG